MKILKGKPVSQGLVIGKAQLLNSKRDFILKEVIDGSGIESEIKRFDQSLEITRKQLEEIYKNLLKSIGEESALIIKTQLLLLNETGLVSEIKNIIKEKKVRTEWAIKEIEKKYVLHFRKVMDLSFREKSNDIMDILGRIIDNLKKSDVKKGKEGESVILIADELPPSVAAGLMMRNKLKGIILDRGGETSHTVILARSLYIPTILDTGNATEMISTDDLLIADGITGEITINPDEQQIIRAEKKKEEFEEETEKLKKLTKLPNRTIDGRKFILKANIEFPFESNNISSYGSEGIGLYRTEFLFTDNKIADSEKEQYLIYKNIAQKVYPFDVTIRTFDIGRDKGNHFFKDQNDENPALGMMAVRLFLKEKNVFKTQLRAILKANESGNIRILFPMVTDIEEVKEINQLLKESEEELKNEGVFHKNQIKKGIMIEVPAAVKLIRHLKNEVDFLSLGSNDLMQYFLAVERNNSALAYLFDPFQPAVIDILKEIKTEADRINKEVTICGEIAAEPLIASLLLGMGYTHFSMNTLSVAEIKKIFIKIEYSYLKSLVSELISIPSRVEIRKYISSAMKKKYQDIF